MLDDHRIAIAAVTACQHHSAIAGGFDRRAAWCGVIDTLVGADFVQDRMATAHGKAGADAGEVYRRADKGFAHAVAVSGVVAGGTLFVGVTHGGEGLAAVDKTGGKDIAVGNRLAVDHFLLVDHFEFVAAADVFSKVDVVAEHIGHVHRQAIGQAGALG